MLNLALTARAAIRTTTPKLLATRTFAVSSHRMADGDTGSSRSGGAASSDAFSRREEASENLYIKQQEQEKLRQLKAKLAESQDSVDAQKKAIEELEKKK